MTEHTLKCWPEPFRATYEGRKSFEIRLDDRAYEVGDIILLREFVHRKEFDKYPPPPSSPLDEPNGYYTRRSLRLRVSYVTRLSDWVPGIEDRWVILGTSEI